MLGIDSPTRLNQYHHTMPIDGFSPSDFSVKGLPEETQLRHPESVLSSIAAVTALLPDLVIFWVNHNHNPN